MKWVLVVWVINGLGQAEIEHRVPGWTSEYKCEEAAENMKRKYNRSTGYPMVTSAGCERESGQPLILPSPQ
jgi:hypothetical protein